MTTTIILFEDGSWEYEEYTGSLDLIKHARIVIGEGWSTKQISQMIREYYSENLSWIFS